MANSARTDRIMVRDLVLGGSSQSWSMELLDSHGFVQSCVEVNTTLAI